MIKRELIIDKLNVRIIPKPSIKKFEIRVPMNANEVK